MSDYIDILGIKINKYDLQQAISKVKYFIDNKQKASIVTPNSEIIVMAQRDKELANIINNADIAVADGAGVLLASKVYKMPLKERVAGFDLMQGLLALAADNNYSLYFLGGEEHIIEKAVENIKKAFPEINISSYHHGFLDDELEKEVIEEINEIKPDILFTGMGVPRQEKFINRNFAKMDATVIMTVGGSFDVLSGKSKRAPLWMQKIHLEWFYRLLQEPSRVTRMTALPYFVFLVIRDRYKRRGKNEV